jgi:hypothetical protein
MSPFKETNGDMILNFLSPSEEEKKKLSDVAAQILELCQGMSLGEVVTRLTRETIKEKDKN